MASIVLPNSNSFFQVSRLVSLSLSTPGSGFKTASIYTMATSTSHVGCIPSQIIVADVSYYHDRTVIQHQVIFTTQGQVLRLYTPV